MSGGGSTSVTDVTPGSPSSASSGTLETSSSIISRRSGGCDLLDVRDQSEELRCSNGASAVSESESETD